MLDGFERRLIMQFADVEGFCKTDRMLFHVLRLVRRDTTFAATVQNLRRMRPDGVLKLTELAQRVCSEQEFETFLSKVKRYRETGITVQKHILSFSNGTQRTIKTGALRVIKEVP